MNRDILDAAARVAANLVVLGVVSRTASSPRANHRHGMKKTRGHRRAVIGQCLRKALRASGNISRIDAILSVLKNPERCIALLGRRLRNGLTRRRLVRIFRDDPRAQALVLAPAALNSS